MKRRLLGQTRVSSSRLPMPLLADKRRTMAVTQAKSSENFAKAAFLGLLSTGVTLLPAAQRDNMAMQIASNACRIAVAGQD